MIPTEPNNLKQWQVPAARQIGRLFTCGRPGRATFGRAWISIDNHTIDLWVSGLPASEVMHIVSLLGRKKGKDCLSEFCYYPFRSSKEPGTKPTFQEWLNEHYGSRFVIHEFPTVDATGIPTDVLKAITCCIRRLLEDGGTVVVVDSAGAERTARVCEAIGAKRMIQKGAM